ncbi:transcriptional regulator [Psychromicrobium lacuslunae]|uniref:Transcriptional regulator n=1 Tax=Psychromicrobium lacuslunae TaxID=1618207 RepID=A0A0D4C339_9MICC|nr:transcriptional regulator [Psychromicrobium lacuslunae]
MGEASQASHRLTVRDVAESSGVAPSAVRFYEEHGVIEAVRTSGNQRRFAESASCRISVARLAQGVGLTVRDMAEIFADFPAEPQAEDWGRVSATLITQAEQRIADLKQQLASLQSGGKLCELQS